MSNIFIRKLRIGANLSEDDCRALDEAASSTREFGRKLLLRMESVGLTRDGSFDLALTQAELGEALGLSHVHVNRMVRQLRNDGLVAWASKRLTVLDRDRLMEFAEFDPNYLHLTKRRDADRALAS